MEELIPWALGLIVGIAYPRSLTLTRGALFIMLIVALGLSVTVLNGEWSENPGYGLVDIGQIWLAAWIAMFARRHFVAGTPRQPAGIAER